MKKIWGVLLFIIYTSIWAKAQAFELYQQGLRAAKSQNWPEFELILEQLKSNAFAPLLKYQYLKNQISEGDFSEVESYIKKHPKSPMAVWLKRQWLDKLYQQNNYNKYVQVYSDVNQQKHHCQYLHALYQIGEQQKAQTLSKALFNTGKKLPYTCEQVYVFFVSNHGSADSILWQRFQLALAGYNFNLAKQLQSLMIDNHQKNAAAILKLYKNYNLITDKKFVANHDSVEVISYGLYRLARRQPQKAIKLFNYYKNRYQWTKLQRQRVLEAVALRYALRKDKRSTQYYKKLVGHDLAPVYETHLFKAALFHQDWSLIKKTIAAYSDDKRSKPRYQYWYGRALISLNEKNKGMEVLQKLAKHRNYYGFLASYYLKQPTRVNHHQEKITQAMLDKVEVIPGYIRAKSFYENGQKHNARLELYYLMKYQPENIKYVIAKQVEKWGWGSQSIRLSAKLENQDDISLRFPIKYQQFIHKHAQNHKVPQPLIYAIIRQESLFTENIKSHAGAVGLMQLLPSTAYRTSKQYKIPYQGAVSLKNAKTNLQLGIAHLNRLNKELHNHPLLIIAAYNAGKNAVNKWLPKNGRTIAPEIWIELVPYKETRRYLRHVVANYVVYQHQLGLKGKLSKLLKPVK